MKTVPCPCCGDPILAEDAAWFDVNPSKDDPLEALRRLMGKPFYFSRNDDTFTVKRAYGRGETL